MKNELLSYWLKKENSKRRIITQKYRNNKYGKFQQTNYDKWTVILVANKKIRKKNLRKNEEKENSTFFQIEKS